MKKIGILGSTGSIGLQTLDVIRRNKDIEVAALSAARNIDKLEEQAREFHPRLVGVYEAAYKEEGLEVGENLLVSDPDTNVFLGVNDQSAAGVMEAFQAAGHTQDVGLFGIDGTDQGMYDVARGTLFKGTVAIPYAQVGEDLVQAALDICAGTSTYEPGSQTIEYWESAMIDESNVEDYRDIWGHLE